METLLQFINKNNKRGIIWWISYHMQNIFNLKEEKTDVSWKQIKLKSSYYPENYPKDGNVFAYLNKEWEGKIMKPYK